MRNVRNVRNFVLQAPDSFLDGIHKASDKVSGGIQRISKSRNGGTEGSLDDEGLLYDDCRVSEQIEANVSRDYKLSYQALVLNRL